MGKKSSVFGYGSLIFKPPPFDGVSRHPGYIKEHVRRFAQFSHDHRGTEERPGRVVTLCTTAEWAPYATKDEPPDATHVWGCVYSIPEELEEVVWRYLDHREKDGYTLRKVDVFGIENGQEVLVEKDCRVYVGETHNPSFGGGLLLPDLAKVIATAEGPSGPNKEYLYMLCDAVRMLCPESEDAYLKELETLVRTTEAANGHI